MPTPADRLASAVRRSRPCHAAVSACVLAISIGACGSSSTKSHAQAKAKNTTTTPTTATKSKTTPARPTIHLDTAKVALAITQSIKTEKHLIARVVCPPNVPQQQGHTFTCVATTYNRVGGKKVPVHTLFTVSQTNSSGNVYYQSPK